MFSKLTHQMPISQNYPVTDLWEVKQWQGNDLVMTISKFNTINLFFDGKLIKQYVFTASDNRTIKIDDVTLLPDRMLFNVSAGALYEFDYQGNMLHSVWVYLSSHQVELLPNGNYLISRCGLDQVAEVTREGKPVWEWSALRNLLPYDNTNFSGYNIVGAKDKMQNPMANPHQQLWENDTRWEWTHVNSVQKLGTDYVIGLRNLDLVLRVSQDKKVISSFGPMVIKHAHHPRILENGHYLIYDNGNGRLVEFDPATQQPVWEYTGLTSPVYGWAEINHDGNYVFPNTLEGIALEVNPVKQILKEVKYKAPADAVGGARAIYQVKTYPLSVLEWLK